MFTILKKAFGYTFGAVAGIMISDSITRTVREIKEERDAILKKIEEEESKKEAVK